MSLSICQFTTATASFEEDVAAYAAAGADAIGICEFKLADDDVAVAALRDAGLTASACVPTTPSILPLPLFEGPSDPGERIAALVASVERLARFEPTCVLFLTGPGRDDEREAVLEGIRAVADAGQRFGVRVALEPVQPAFRELWSIPTSLDEAAGLLEEAGRPDVGLLFDTWHLWDGERLEEQIERHRGRIAGVHVADWREPTRSTNDRVLPGDGVADLTAILAALDWDGPYDLEIFSDPELEGSLWRLEPAELARRGIEALRGVVPS